MITDYKTKELNLKKDSHAKKPAETLIKNDDILDYSALTGLSYEQAKAELILRNKK